MPWNQGGTGALSRMQVVEKGAMDVLFTADASPWAPDAGTRARAHQMLGEAHRCAAGQRVGRATLNPILNPMILSACLQMHGTASFPPCRLGKMRCGCLRWCAHAPVAVRQALL